MQWGYIYYCSLKYVIYSYIGWSDEDFTIERWLLHWVEWWRLYHWTMKYIVVCRPPINGVFRKEFPVIWVILLTNIIALKYIKRTRDNCTWGLSAKLAPFASHNYKFLKKINVIFSLEKHFASWWGTVVPVATPLRTPWLEKNLKKKIYI